MNYFAHNSWPVHSLIILLCFFSVSVFAQIGGRSAFDFMNVPHNGRLAALGGVNVSLTDRDANFFSANPALVGDTLNGIASASYQSYVAGIGNAFLSYVHPFSRLGTVAFGIQHVNYGSLQGYDASGLETAEFKSGETALMISKAHQISNFRLGISLKGAFSSIAGYRSTAVMADLGGVFIHPGQRFTAGIVFKNIGFILSEYSETNGKRLPFDVRLGATLKPEHMPLRFSLTAFNLSTPDASYFDPAAAEDEPGTLKKVMSHLNLGTEILIHKNVNVMVGYNYFLHQALKYSGGGAGAGISVGFSAAIRSIEFVFSRNAYAAGNAAYTFTLSTNVQKLLKRR